MITRRKSALRTQILSLLREKHLLSAPDIIGLLKKEGSTVNKTSVYRAIDILTEQHLISRKTIGSEAQYELSDHHHDHIVCTNCGTVQSVECALTLPETSEGFVVQDHTLTLYGLCPSCQATP